MTQNDPCCSAVTTQRGLHRLCISIVPIFNHLDHEDMEKIAKVTAPTTLKKGEHLFRAGDSSHSLYIIHLGKIKVYRLAENGKEQVIRILTPGDFTGELSLFTDLVHDTYAVATEATDICRIQRTQVQDMLVAYPAIALKVLQEFSTRLDQSEMQTTQLGTESIETRLGFYLAQQMEENHSSVIQLPMARKDLASFLGTTPETLSRKLAVFESNGWIAQEGQRRIAILNMDALLLV